MEGRMGIGLSGLFEGSDVGNFRFVASDSVDPTTPQHISCKSDAADATKPNPRWDFFQFAAQLQAFSEGPLPGLTAAERWLLKQHGGAPPDSGSRGWKRAPGQSRYSFAAKSAHSASQMDNKIQNTFGDAKNFSLSTGSSANGAPPRFSPGPSFGPSIPNGSSPQPMPNFGSPPGPGAGLPPWQEEQEEVDMDTPPEGLGYVPGAEWR